VRKTVYNFHRFSGLVFRLELLIKLVDLKVLLSLHLVQKHFVSVRVVNFNHWQREELLERLEVTSR
jgi:hypothetical protein